VTRMDREHHDGAVERRVAVVPEPSCGAPTPAMSVIVTTPDSYDTIRPLIGRLRAQTARDALEVVIVAPSADVVRAGVADLQGFCSWRVVELGELRTVAQAKAAGIRHATAPVVVLTEDHSLPHPTWARALIDAHRQPWAAVGPAMDNGNPESLISWADFTIGYGAWLDPPAGEADCLPGHNSAYKRDILLGFGARLEALLGAEAALHAELRARGWRLCMQPAAKTFHVNFTQPTRWVFYLLHSGRLFAAERARAWPLARRALFSGGAWLIPFVRLKRSLQQLRRARPDLVPRVLPALLFALVLDGIGQWLGYTFGAGRAAEKVARLEFHRAGTASADAALQRSEAGSAVRREG
jgi:GT2 family glycosyltransferase